MTGTQLLSNSVKSLSAKQRIASFRQRFGEGHFYLACHAAMPVSLTPDLLYSLWANFQRDTYGDAIEIPWIAVADFMLSSLCEEVGQELYEIDQEVQDELLKQLQQDSRLGLERIQELTDFVMAYVEQQLDSPDLDVRDLAQGQQWKALAYKNPSEAARSIATVLAQLPLSDKSEWIRMDALIGSLAEPLSAYQPLLNYIRAMASLERGNLDAAIAQMSKAVNANKQVQVEGINLPIPDILHGKLPDLTELDASSALFPNKFVLPIAIIGGMVISLLSLIGIQNWLRSPNSQSSPKIASSVSPSPQTNSPTSPGIQRSPSTPSLPSSSNSSTPSPSTSSTSRGTPNPTSSSRGVATPASPRTTSPSSSVQQPRSPSSPTLPSSPSPTVTPTDKPAQSLQEALNKISASRPGEPLAVSPDQQYIASGGRDGVLRLWGIDAQLLKSFGRYEGKIYSVSFSPDGLGIATAGTDGSVRLWDRSGNLITTLNSNQGFVTSVSFSPDGQRLVTAGTDGSVKLWDSSGKLLMILNSNQGSVTSVSFSPDGLGIATAGTDGSVRLWDRSGKLLMILKGNQGSVTSVSFSPDGQRIVTAGTDGSVKLWDSDGRTLATLNGNQGSVTSVSFSPDGQRIVTAGTDGSVKLWDSDRRTLATLNGNQGSVTSVSFSPDGSMIITVGANNSLRFWDKNGRPIKQQPL